MQNQTELSSKVKTFIKENPTVKSTEIAKKFSLSSWQKVASYKRRQPKETAQKPIKKTTKQQKVLETVNSWDYKIKGKITAQKISEELGITKTIVSSYNHLLGIRLTDLNNKNLGVTKKPKQQKERKFKNENGAKKQQARDKMINAIEKSGLTEGKVLTLPSHTCKLEMQLNETVKNKFDYLGCEYDKDVYFEMLNVIAKNKLNINTYKGSVGDKVYQAKENEYSHLLLDYCGVLNTFAKEIKFAVKNNIVKKGGTISVTLSKMGIGNSKGIIGELLENIPQDLFSNEKETALGAKLFFSKLVGGEYKMETFFEYYDTSPMMLIVLRRSL